MGHGRQIIEEIRARAREGRLGGELPKPSDKTCKPGTELKRLIGWIPALVPWWNVAGCSCDEIAHRMDYFGHVWCLQNMEHIVKTIKRSAVKGGVWVPFMEPMIRAMVRRAIANSVTMQKDYEPPTIDSNNPPEPIP